MKITALLLRESQVKFKLLPLLVGRVFHVTSLSVFAQIRAAGEIRPNVNGEFQTTFGSTNSYFRNRGCVSFFDYRSATPEQIEDAIRKCSPFDLPFRDPQLGHKANIAYLFLSNTAYGRLRSWTESKKDGCVGEKIVPWVEAGFPGSVPVALIEEVLRVTIDYPADSLADRLRSARFGRG